MSVYDFSLLCQMFVQKILCTQWNVEASEEKTHVKMGKRTKNAAQEKQQTKLQTHLKVFDSSFAMHNEMNACKVFHK